MVGTVENPVRLWPYRRVTNVHWPRPGGISASIQFKLGLSASYFLDGQSCPVQETLPTFAAVDENSLQFNTYTYVGGVPTAIDVSGVGSVPATIGGFPSLPSFEFVIWDVQGADGYTTPSGLPGQQTVAGLSFPVFNVSSHFQGNYCIRREGGPHSGQLRTVGLISAAGVPQITVHHSEFTLDLSAVTATAVISGTPRSFVASAISLQWRPDTLTSTPAFSSEEAFTLVSLSLDEVT